MSVKFSLIGKCFVIFRLVRIFPDTIVSGCFTIEMKTRELKCIRSHLMHKTNDAWLYVNVYA